MEREVGQPNPHPWAVVMGFDQSPADPRKAWWTTFLGQETAWYYGLEKYARTYDMAVLYGHIRKPSRGHYVTEYELITDNPRSLPEGAILEACIARLEADIRANPAQWLWTHKRWKHRRPADLPLHPRTAP
jgi:KDO2-lipid IV(A) lauroyltransferase